MSTAPANNASANNRRPMRQGRLVAVGRIEDVPIGRGAIVELADGAELALFHTEEGFYAVENFCPHRGAPLADGELEGCAITCSLHGWRFDLRTGACLSHASDSIELYEVVIEQDEIKIRI